MTMASPVAPAKDDGSRRTGEDGIEGTGRVRGVPGDADCCGWFCCFVSSRHLIP
jgi:hypothetical protein